MSLRPLPLCVAASLVLGGVASSVAQPVPLPASASPSSPLPALAPPPGRVGRVASVSGAVSFHLAGATEWQVASANLPVTTGAGFWVAPGGEAALGIADGNRMVIGPATQLDIDLFDDQAFTATQPQGESYLHLQLVPPSNTYSVRTPRGTVTMASAGRYEIVSGDTEHPTTITVLDGAATLTGIPTTAEIGAGQTLTIIGDGTTTPFTPSIGPAVQDEFLKHVLAEERPRPARSAVAPAILSQMTGAEALDGVGAWSENADYGPVWYPPAANYVPYRQGRWAYVAPWGWTWVDDAPWGFAPTHYGRWTQVDNRWGWVPGRDWQPDRRPVYAPALVGFLATAALGYASGPSVGWAPLGPRDRYRPPYAVDERTVQILNQPTGANIQITNAPVFINRTAITIVPTRVMTNSAQVAGAFRPGLQSAAMGPATSFDFRPQAAPTRSTIGATQVVLRQINPTGLTAPASHIGPGPALYARPQSPGPAGAQAPGGGAIGPAALLGAGAAGAIAGGVLHQPSAPRAALPDLRPRGATPFGPGGQERPPLANGVVPGPGAAPGAGPGAIARPAPPVAPAVAMPRGPGAIPTVDRAIGGPPGHLAGPNNPRPTPAPQAPVAAARPDFPPNLRREQAEPHQPSAPPQSQPQLQFRPHQPEARADFAAPPRQPIAAPSEPAQFQRRQAPPPEQFQHRDAPPPQQAQRPTPRPQEAQHSEPPPQVPRAAPPPQQAQRPEPPPQQRHEGPRERPDHRPEH